MTYYINIENTGLENDNQVRAMAEAMQADGHAVEFTPNFGAINTAECPVSESGWFTYVENANNSCHTLAEVADLMRDHDRAEAPGSETMQWGALCEDAQAQYGIMPYDSDEAAESIVDPDFYGFWAAIADHNYSLAERYGDVPNDWDDDAE